MAVPYVGKREGSSKEGQLFFANLITSPAIPQAGDTYLSDVRIKDVDIKSIYMEKTANGPDPSWSGARYPWAKGVTEIQSEFVETIKDSNSQFNLLYNSSLATNSYANWIPIYEDPYKEDSTSPEQTYNWIPGIEPPTDVTAIWLPTVDNDFYKAKKYVPKMKMGQEDYYSFKQSQSRNKDTENTVSLIKNRDSSSYQFNIKKNKLNYYVGVSQTIKLKYPIDETTPLTVSFNMVENTWESQGVVVRMEFYTKEMKLVDTQFSNSHVNRNGVSKVRRSSTFRMEQRNPISDQEAEFIRVTFMATPGYGKTSDFNIDGMKMEFGSRATGWNRHEEEIRLDLNAGEINLPLVNGELDTSKMISEIAILRSVLNEGLLKWEEVTRLKSSSMREAIYHDYFVENGNYYRYALQPILLNGMKGAITKFFDVVTTFDGFWLLGEEDYQFSFIYNGKIDSIKHNKPYDIIETIAGQYPYISRASELDYRSYNFSGTLTTNQDILKLFSSDSYSVAVSPDPTIPIHYVDIEYGNEELLNCKNDLEESQEGMVMQRLWRDKIVKWLKDGKPKIMKSEAQGNMLVVLTEVQVTPNETTFGLISDFTCVVTEIGPLTEKTLQKYKLRKEMLTKDELIKEAIKNSSVE